MAAEDLGLNTEHMLILLLGNVSGVGAGHVKITLRSGNSFTLAHVESKNKDIYAN